MILINVSTDNDSNFTVTSISFRTKKKFDGALVVLENFTRDSKKGIINMS